MSTQKFGIGDTVRCNAKSNVRSSPGIQSGNLVGTQPVGAVGIVVAGPQSAGTYLWYEIAFDVGVDGWVGSGTLNQ